MELFYSEQSSISTLSEQAVHDLRATLEVKCGGAAGKNRIAFEDFRGFQTRCSATMTVARHRVGPGRSLRGKFSPRL